MPGKFFSLVVVRGWNHLTLFGNLKSILDGVSVECCCHQPSYISVCSKPFVILYRSIIIVVVVFGLNLVRDYCSGAILQLNLPFFPLGEVGKQWVGIRCNYRPDL